MIMKPTSLTLVTAALVTVAAAACFSDPTSDLQNGPARIAVSRSTVVLGVNDTDLVNIQVLDAAGTALPLENVSYASSDVAVATIEPLPDSVLVNLPGDLLTKAIVIGHAVGTSTVTVNANGLSTTFAVVGQ